MFIHKKVPLIISLNQFVQKRHPLAMQFLLQERIFKSSLESKFWEFGVQILGLCTLWNRVTLSSVFVSTPKLQHIVSNQKNSSFLLLLLRHGKDLCYPRQSSWRKCHSFFKTQANFKINKKDKERLGKRSCKATIATLPFRKKSTQFRYFHKSDLECFVLTTPSYWHLGKCRKHNF